MLNAPGNSLGYELVGIGSEFDDIAPHGPGESEDGSSHPNHTRELVRRSLDYADLVGVVWDTKGITVPID